MKICYYLSIALVAFILFTPSQKASALSAANWKAGRIIDDAVFFNKDAISVQQIQDFLNAKVPTCDRNHQSFFWMNGKYHQPPYTCLKEYNENPTTRENNIGRFNANGSPMVVSGGKSSAQIIWEVGQTYNINPQALIVMLQKETGLVTDTWAATWQYDRAMGYACPDTAACDTSFYGFYNQVNSAAKQIRNYVNNPDWFNFKAGVTRNIRWSTNAACGSSPVYIETQATAALYNYTPYQPNSTALSNLSGSQSDGCSQYGNRNFWVYFNNWFGASVGVLPQNYAIWRLYNPVSGGHIFTASANEATQYMSAGWHNDGIVMHSDPNGIPVYRLWNGKYHFFTASAWERDNYIRAGWHNDGIVFNSSTTGSPVYRLWNGRSHFMTADSGEAENYVKAGWHNDGIVFYQPTNEIHPIWRLYNPVSGGHIFTASANEATQYMSAGWHNDGIVMHSDPNGIPVYRLWNGKYHFFTASAWERDNYIRAGWHNDGIVFNSSTTGSPVYRLWNGRSHFMTADSGEAENYVKAGWHNDGIVFYTNNLVGIRRIYNSSTGARMEISNISTLWALAAEGWTDEGIHFYASTSFGKPVYELFNRTTNSRYYTNKVSDITTYSGAGWINHGIVFYTLDNDKPIYRLYNPATQQHILTGDTLETSSLTSANWINDGVIFNSSR